MYFCSAVPLKSLQNVGLMLFLAVLSEQRTRSLAHFTSFVFGEVGVLRVSRDPPRKLIEQQEGILKNQNQNRTAREHKHTKRHVERLFVTCLCAAFFIYFHFSLSQNDMPPAFIVWRIRGFVGSIQFGTLNNKNKKILSTI